MTSDGRVQLGWDVVETDWTHFREKVARDRGTAACYLNSGLEYACREFLDTDDFAPLEVLLRSLVRATGRSQGDKEEKNPLKRRSDESRTRVWVSIHPDLKSELEAFAQEKGLPKWMVLTAVVREYNSGGRAQRCLDLLTSEVVTEIEDILDDIASTNGKSKPNPIVIAVAKEIGDGFTEDELSDAISNATSGTKHYQDKIGPLVIERKGVVELEKPDGPNLFLQPEIAAAKQTSEIIALLGINEEAPTTLFSREEFAQAVRRAGIEVNEQTREHVNSLRELMCTRLSYDWDGTREVFGPISARTSAFDEIDSAHNPPEEESSNTRQTATETDAENRLDEIAASKPVENSVDS